MARLQRLLRERTLIRQALGELLELPGTSLQSSRSRRGKAQYETQFVDRLVRWWREHARVRFSLLFGPHPRAIAAPVR
jgi:hypothetical protein